jgi:resuscitation-promoting factor RpfA
MPDFFMRQRRAAQMFVITLAVLLPVGLVGAVLPAPAHAATVRTWDRLAWCESSGRWHINSGNGYYGGLQFSGPTWRAFGGARFARYAHRASKAEQIRVAERVRRHQGWRAWPSCSLRLGLR